MINVEEEDFKTELGKVRNHFDMYTKAVRTKSLRFCMAMIAVNWAVFGSFDSAGGTISTLIVENKNIIKSFNFSLLGIFLTVLYDFLYAVYLKWEDKRIQKDYYSNEKQLFKNRKDPKSSYPFHSATNWAPLFVDFLILCSLILSVYYFIYAVHK